jgi:polysaccharide biosynthesis/export protein
MQGARLVARSSRFSPVLAVFAAAIVGCTTYEEAEIGVKPSYRYRLGANDGLRVSVWGRPELQTDTTVAPDGRVALPLAGNMAVAGLTLEEAAEKLAVQLKEFVRDPIVCVELRELKSSQIQVVGEVRTPGSVPYYNGMTFLEAIQRCGSYVHEFANVSHFLLVRDSLGAKQIFEYDMDAMLTDPEGPKDVFLQPGDIVYVPPRYVTQFSRWVNQALSPITAFSRVAYATAGTAAYLPAGSP